jgi:carbonic anhydrase
MAMTKPRRSACTIWLGSLLLTCFLLTTPPSIAAAPAAAVEGVVDARTGLKRLQEGNARFRGLEPVVDHRWAARRTEVATGQHPFAVIVGCADSRTAPELLFDQGLGDLFVLRTAGNLVDDFSLGSLEYAVEHLGARLVVVLGHERCGAVAAGLAGGEAPGHIAALVHDIAPAIATFRRPAEATEAERASALEAAVKVNVARVAERIRAQAQLGDKTAEVLVVRAYYDLDTGVVEFVP